MPDFISALHSGRPLLMDGAMGSQLQRAGMKPGECFELWNITQPEKVRAVHRTYVDAGAQCILTNTFQSNPAALARHGLQDRLEEINSAAVQLARSASVSPRYVLASIGPMDIGADVSGFDRTIRSLDRADALLLETWTDQFEIAARRAVDSSVNPKRIPVLLSIAFMKSADHETPVMPSSNRTARQVAEVAEAQGIAALGMNCGRDLDLDEIVSIVSDYRSITALPLFARPNAGTPKLLENQRIYPHSPEIMASWLSPLKNAGISMIGGCCGTTPEHIEMFRDRFK